jgi:hypothetical protein
MSEPLGDLINALGVEHSPDPGEMTTDAIVIMKVVTSDGRVLLRTCYSDGMSWVERVGMLRIAERSELDSLNDDG